MSSMYVNDLSRKKDPENRELKVKLRYDLCETAYPQIKIVNPPPTYKVIREMVEQKTKEMEEEKKLLINVRISESKILETGNSKEEECKQVQKNIKNTEKKEKKAEKQSNQKKVPVKNIVISKKRKNSIESSDDNDVTDADTLTCFPFAVPKPKVKRVYNSKKVFL